MTGPVPTYRFQDGRRYNAYDEETYYLPNDEAETSRLGPSFTPYQ
jgi:hypothetical protein